MSALRRTLIAAILFLLLVLLLNAVVQWVYGITLVQLLLGLLGA